MKSSDNVSSLLSLRTKSRTFQKTSLTRLLLSFSRSEVFTEDKGNNVFVNLFAHVFVPHTLLPRDSEFKPSSDSNSLENKMSLDLFIIFWRFVL